MVEPILIPHILVVLVISPALFPLLKLHFSFSYSLITKSKYGLLKGVLVIVIDNYNSTTC